MGFFDFFKKKKVEQPSGSSPAAAALKNAEEQFKEGNDQEALQALVEGFGKDVELKALYKLASACLGRLGGVEEKALFDAALQDFENPDVFAALGDHFVEVSHYSLAQPFLEKTLALQENNMDAAHNLAIVHAREFNLSGAIKVLEEVAEYADFDFWTYWFYTKCKILNNEATGITEGLKNTIRAMDEAPNQQEVELPRSKIEELQEIITRLEQHPSPKEHIQDWHFIQYGGAILDYFDDTEEYVAGGRYVASWGSEESVKTTILKLQDFLKTLEVKPNAVCALPDRDSQIVGGVIAELLKLPKSTYNSKQPLLNALIVSAETSAFADYPELAIVRHGQLLFTLFHDWLTSAFITPDLIGFMAQSYAFPWAGGGFRIIDIEKGELEETEPDDRDAAVIVKEIVETEAVLGELDYSFYKQQLNFLKGIGENGGEKRYNFMVESPVPGARFG